MKRDIAKKLYVSSNGLPEVIFFLPEPKCRRPGIFFKYEQHNCVQQTVAKTHQRTHATTGRCARNTLSRGSRNVGIWPLAKNCLSISALAGATVTGASLTPRTVNYLVRIRHSHQILVGRLMFEVQYIYSCRTQLTANAASIPVRLGIDYRAYRNKADVP